MSYSHFFKAALLGAVLSTSLMSATPAQARYIQTCQGGYLVTIRTVYRYIGMRLFPVLEMEIGQYDPLCRSEP